MNRIRRSTDLGKDLSEWKNHTWDVTLHVNARQSITSMNVTCHRRLDEKTKVEGHAATQVQPFDDMHELIRATMVEAAIRTLDASPDHGDQPSLDDLI